MTPRTFQHADEAPECHCGEVFMAESVDSEGTAYRECAIVEYGESFNGDAVPNTHHTKARCWAKVSSC